LKSIEKPQRGDLNIAWGSAPGNPSYDHVEYKGIKDVPTFIQIFFAKFGKKPQ
jgi:hypothetical protein